MHEVMTRILAKDTSTFPSKPIPSTTSSAASFIDSSSSSPTKHHQSANTISLRQLKKIKSNETSTIYHTYHTSLMLFYPGHKWNTHDISHDKLAFHSFKLPCIFLLLNEVQETGLIVTLNTNKMMLTWQYNWINFSIFPHHPDH